ncbi:uncharacterized protein METZ01_LOCUS412769 [marine metagenome]|uniref:Uncharacterized protein n=1 Tax=marine metagenome TaxID=408172 RepID=A0A382WNH0_9ZZZZ
MSNLVDGTGTVDYYPPVGFGGGHGPVGGHHPSMELVSSQLDAVEVAASPVDGHRTVDVDEDYQVSGQALGGEGRHGGHVVRAESATMALVCDRGFEIAVGNHMATLGQSRTDYLGDVLGSRGGDHQRLGPVHRVVAGRVKNHVAEPLP